MGSCADGSRGLDDPLVSPWVPLGYNEEAAVEILIIVVDR